MGMLASTQENLLALLAFDERGKLVRGLVPLSAWDFHYLAVAEECYNYWLSYNCAPTHHLSDIVNGLIAKRPKDEKALLEVLRVVTEAHQAGVNADYVIDQASSFVRQQQLRDALAKANELVQKGELAEAEGAVKAALKVDISLFNAGINSHDSDSMLRFLDKPNECMPTGVAELDAVFAGPRRKELHIFMAPRGRGKSWWLINLAKHALLSRHSVVHVSLEMAEEQVAMRYCQALFSVSKRPTAIEPVEFDRDELGRFVGFRVCPGFVRPSLQDDDIEQFLRGRLGKLIKRAPLIIKQFPTGMLTMSGLAGYLDSLWATAHISPDLLLIDYADLMKMGTIHLREELGTIYKELRGLAVERNMAVVTASQTNREGESAKIVRGKHAAEDISKMATADVAITYSQTDQEHDLRLARLFVEKNRDDEDKHTVLIAQDYRIGQFVKDSVRMASHYWSSVTEATGDIETSNK